MSMTKEEKVLAANRAAFHNYHISDKYEAGIVLTGTEVKSAMDGRVQLKEAYISVREGEAWLFNAHISPYSHGNRENHDPLRTRKLLLHKREISRLDEATAKQGMTLVPTQLYLKNGRIKIEVGVARGPQPDHLPAGEHSAPVHRRVRPAGERKLSGQLVARVGTDIPMGVEIGYGDSRCGGELVPGLGKAAGLGGSGARLGHHADAGPGTPVQAQRPAVAVSDPRGLTCQPRLISRSSYSGPQ